MIRFASLGSGSQGNALVVAAGETAVLVDCGFSIRSTVERLGRLGLVGADLSAIFVTHEHSDHAGGVFALARRFSLPVYLTQGTWRAVSQRLGTQLSDASGRARLIAADSPFTLAGLEVHPFSVPHDACEPVQYVFAQGDRRLGVLTDSGHVTPGIVERLRLCDALVLEFNHDRQQLARSSYPAMLKRRIAGGQGHLENGQAVDLLRQIGARRVQHLVAAHLSQENNCPQRVLGLLLEFMAGEVAGGAQRIVVADQHNGCAWREIV